MFNSNFQFSKYPTIWQYIVSATDIIIR